MLLPLGISDIPGYKDSFGNGRVTQFTVMRHEGKFAVRKVSSLLRKRSLSLWYVVVYECEVWNCRRHLTRAWGSSQFREEIRTQRRAGKRNWGYRIMLALKPPASGLPVLWAKNCLVWGGRWWQREAGYSLRPELPDHPVGTLGIWHTLTRLRGDYNSGGQFIH